MTKLDRVAASVRRASVIQVDTLIALAILLIGLAEYLFFYVPTPGYPLGGPSFALLTLATLSLTFRRTRLWIPYLIVHGCFLATPIGQYNGIFGLGGLLVSFVLVYTVAERTPARPAALATLAEIALWFHATTPPAPGQELRLPTAELLGFALFWVSLFGVAWFAGRMQRRRRRLTTELQSREQELRAERERQAELAVARERRQVALELQSLVIGGVQSMTSQAGAARGQLQHDLGRPDESISTIESTGRRTLVEMRRLLGVLRRAEDASRRDPQSRLAGQPETQGKVDHALPKRDGIALDDPMIIRRLKRALRTRWFVDGAIVAAVAGMVALEFVLGSYHGWIRASLALVPIVALLFRRTAPVLVLATVATTEFLWILIGDTPTSGDRALLIAVFSVAETRSLGWAVSAVGIGILAWSPYPVKQLCLCLLEIGAFSTFAAIAGWSTKEGRRLNAELREQTETLARTRQERILLVVREERSRVAREMHDVVAHGITTMVMHAGAARMVAPTDTARAIATLTAVERMGTESLQELTSLLESLDPEPNAGAMSASVDGEHSVTSLAEQARDAGMQLDLVVEGEPQTLDGGLEISLYRIVQEALTNIRRHAPGALASIRLRYLPEAVEVEVFDRGRTPGEARDSIPGTGHGLIGIRERATVFGGEATAGPTPDGGFRVLAHLPIELVRA